jgi:hypothetical protein
MHNAVLVAAVMLTACRLDAQVSDEPGASAHILPANAVVPAVAQNTELVNQIYANDGIDDPGNNVAPLGTGQSDGNPVHYWSFGAATLSPAPLFELVPEDPGGEPIDHPPLVYTLPGDPGYNPLHSIYRVVVTEKYRGQRITTAEALADAIELGYVEEPEPTRTFINLPIVLAETQLDTMTPSDPAKRISPNETLYARGYQVSAFRFGGPLRVQPLGGFLPAMQVSFVHGPGENGYNTARPIFQATVPPPPPVGSIASYSALSNVIRVDLQNGLSTSISSDAELFTRDPLTGAIMRTSGNVARLDVTSTYQVLQLQFPGESP